MTKQNNLVIYKLARDKYRVDILLSWDRYTPIININLSKQISIKYLDRVEYFLEFTFDSHNNYIKILLTKFVEVYDCLTSHDVK